MKKISLTLLTVLAVSAIFPKSDTLLFAQGPSSSVVLERPIDAKYLNVGKKEYMLVFYGYVGCVKVCSPVLDNLNRFYSSDAFSKFEPFVDLIFVNLLPKVSQDQPDQFAKVFNANFIGVYLTEKELSGIDKELNVYFSKRIDDSFELDHSDHIYLIKREKDGKLTLINIYTTHPLNQASIIDDLTQYTQNH